MHTHTHTYAHIRIWQYGLRCCAAPVGVIAAYKPNIELRCLPLFLHKSKRKNKAIMTYNTLLQMAK